VPDASEHGFYSYQLSAVSFQLFDERG
jgi:hypothetical protein